MTDATMTLALTGRLSLARFVQATGTYRALVDALTDEIGPTARIDWVVEDLLGGSAMVTIHGASPHPEDTAAVSHAFLRVGRALAAGDRPAYGESVVEAARGLVSLLGDEITAIRFETAEDDAVVGAATDGQEHGSLLGAYGAVQGRVQPLPSTTSHRFTLYDTLYGCAVSCYLPEGCRDSLHGLWGQRAEVEGWVSRDRASGWPVSIRRIRRLARQEEPMPGAFLRARGILPAAPGDPLPEERIRRLRDEE